MIRFKREVLAHSYHQGMETQYMTIPTTNIRLTFTFTKNLDNIEIQAATNQRVHQLHRMGAVRGREQLEDLMVQTGIDRWIDFSGESGTIGSVAQAIAATPKEIIDWLERNFQKEDGLELEILDREDKMPRAERSFTAPESLTVCSSHVTAATGVERLREWFAAKPV
jgi:hypothetical protein